jgi:hypothetical protein
VSTIIDNAMRQHQPRYHKPHSTMPIRCNRGKVFQTEKEFFQPLPVVPEVYFGKERTERPKVKPQVWYPKGWFNTALPPRVREPNLATMNVVTETPPWVMRERMLENHRAAETTPETDPEVLREQQLGRAEAEKERREREEKVAAEKVYVTPPEPWYLKRKKVQQ